MQPFHINYLALVVAAVAKGIIGFIWYSPPVFLSPWLQLNGFTAESMKQDMVRPVVIELGCNIVMAFVLVHAIHYAGANTASLGAVSGFWNWLGFVGTVGLTGAIYERRSLKLWGINTGYQLTGLVVMGAIIAAWT